MRDIPNLNNLNQVLVVPNSPVNIDRNRLKLNETALSLKFPDDFVEFSTTYGSGRVSAAQKGFDLSSGCSETYTQFVRKFVKRQNEYRVAMETFDVGLGLFPETGGLLPFGKDDSGTYFCWDTNQSPNDWTVVVIWEYDNDGYMRKANNFSQFLCGILTGKDPHPLWGSNWKPELPTVYIPLKKR